MTDRRVSRPNARVVAAELLMRIRDERITLDEALDQSEAFDGLEGADRGFARTLISTVLRMGLRLDVLLSRHLNRPLEDLDPPVQDMLRLGAAQICVLETPSHAAVSESVAAIRSWPGVEKASGLVNAVLRKIANAPDTLAAIDPLDAWPQAFRFRMIGGLGPRAASALARHQTQPPCLDLTVNSDPDTWADRLGGEVVSGVTVRLSLGQAVESLEGYAAGGWWVQDVAATLPARLLAPSPMDKVLDLCAAPGGKTLQLAASGAEVTAVDNSDRRLARLRENLARCDLTAETVTADIQSWSPARPADHVLLDAPCSALGTLRRHPEGPLIKRTADLASFPALQWAMLERMEQFVRPGGRLVYCVCTPLPEEGVDLIERLLGGGPWKRVPVAPDEVPGFEVAVTGTGDVLTLPSLVTVPGGSDVFYIARLERMPD